MKVRCPRCGAELDVADDLHYHLLPCPKCGSKFQVTTESTQQVSREFLAQILRDIEAGKKPSE